MRIYLKDPKTGEQSVTLTMFVLGMVVCIAKLMISGMTIQGFAMSAFSGVDFAAAVGALGAVYVARRNLGDPS